MTESSAFAAAVCDAGPLIHLDELGCLPLLGDFPRVLVPATVWAEAVKHRPNLWRDAAVKFERVPPAGSIPPEIEALTKLLTLHPGEVEALQVTQAYPGNLLLTDDTAARLAAQQLRLSVHGTIGILLRAIRRRQRSAREIAALLRELPQRSTLHIKRELLHEIVAQVESSE